MTTALPKVTPIARLIATAILFCVLVAPAAFGEQPFIVLASTTSVDNSGLLGHILPQFTAETGIAVRVLALGTGQALDTARRGDADLVLVHDPEAEDKFIADGDGVDRQEIAWNDFIIVGPKNDPARINGGRDGVQAFRAIWDAKGPFISRGDRSGTDAQEKRLWKAAGLNPTATEKWYKEIGGGMGAALNIASAAQAYTLSDRGTWLSFGDRGDLVILVAGDPRLLNRYDVIQLDPKRHPEAKHRLAGHLADWLASPRGQSAIGAYTIADERLFHPEADPKPGLRN